MILQHHGQNSSPSGASKWIQWGFDLKSLSPSSLGEGDSWVLSAIKELKYLFLLFPLSHVLNHFQAVVGFALKFVE